MLTMQNSPWHTLFSVPTAVVDQYLKLATPSQLKVLLYLLRHQPEQIDTEQIGKQIGCLPELVEEAILFWQQTEILSAPEAAPAQPSVPAVPEVQPSVTAALESTPATEPVPEPKPQTGVATIPRTSAEVQMLPTEMAAAIQQSESLQILFRMAEKEFGQLLRPMEQRSLIWLHDYLGFSSDIILLVLAYCHKIGKHSIAYAEQILADWWSQEIDTMQKAQEAIMRMEENRSYRGQIMRMLEMHRNPTPKQQSYIELWQKNAVPMDLIRYAYEKTVEQTDKLSFPYIDRILQSWTEAGYQTRQDVDANDKPPAAQPYSKKKSKEIPVSENADAYRSLIYNLDE